jgi:peptide/nickel transport system substrate-binding protein
MFTNKRLTIALGLIIMLSMMIGACQPETVVETVIVTEVVVEEGKEVIKEVVVTPTPAPVSFSKDDTSTFVETTFGEPGSLDMAWNYETAGNTIIMNVYDTLIFYDRQFGGKFIPQLATEWTLSDDGMTYTFTIREGVKFHEGQDLTASDVEYSFERAILQGGGWSPMWLLVEPFFGVGYHDVAELVDPDLVDDKEGLLAADAEAVKAVCDQLDAAIVSDNDAGTVTMTLATPWGPFLPTIAAGWAGITDEDWAMEQGAWDGDCANWVNFYGVDDETAPLAKVMNGTGPFKFDHWTPGEEIVLLRNDDYWRTEPGWEGGPSGPAAIERVVKKYVDEWGTRFAMFQAGDTDFIAVPRQNVSQVDPLVGERCDYNGETFDFDCAPTENPEAPFRLFIGHPGVSRTDAMLTWNINDEGGNPLLGSAELDGNGIPPDFFMDLDARLAFQYCFDWDAYIDEALVGEAVQNVGVLIPGMIGYDPNGSKYSFDLEKCQEHIEKAWEGAVAENGFRIQVAFNTGNLGRQTYAQILQSGFQQVDSKYAIEIIGLPWPSFLNFYRASRLPVTVSGWLEDLHDPHNWAQPFCIGTYAARQKLPDDVKARYKELVDAGVAETDDAKRAEIYMELQEYDYSLASAIRGAVATGRHYEQRWVEGWYYNPIYPGSYFYSLSLK